MPQANIRTDEEALRTRWAEQGLSEQARDDLIVIANELTVVTGKPLGSCLVDVEQAAKEQMESNLLGRVRDTIQYGGDLHRGR